MWEAQPVVGDTTPGQVVLDVRRKQVEYVNELHSSMAFASFSYAQGSRLDFLPWDSLDGVWPRVV